MKTIYKNANIVSKGVISEGALLAENGKIQKIFTKGPLPAADEIIDLKGDILCGGFIDGHIHGTGGFGTDRDDADALLKMSEILLTQGVIGFLPTLYPAPKEKLLKTLAILSEAFGKEKGAELIGFHLEGPFISPEKLGVMTPASLSKIDMDFMEEIYKASKGLVRSMTVAPELEGIELLANYAREHNIVLQAGHSNALAKDMARAKELGIKHSTHLFNAMRGFNHREIGCAGAILSDADFSAEVIADGFHISPSAVQMVLKLKEPSKIILVTDSLSPTGTRGGMANGEEVYFDGVVFRRKKDNVIAGSSLKMLEGVKNLVKWGMPLGAALCAASENPSRLFDLNFGRIENGREAKFLVLDKELNLKRIVA